MLKNYTILSGYINGCIFDTVTPNVKMGSLMSTEKKQTRK